MCFSVRGKTAWIQKDPSFGLLRIRMLWKLAEGGRRTFLYKLLWWWRILFSSLRRFVWCSHSIIFCLMCIVTLWELLSDTAWETRECRVVLSGLFCVTKLFLFPRPGWWFSLFQSQRQRTFACLVLDYFPWSSKREKKIGGSLLPYSPRKSYI